jgi:hypothetical protein
MVDFPFHWPRTACHTNPLPKGPQGQKRPADVIGNAAHVVRIAPGKIEDLPKNGDFKTFAPNPHALFRRTLQAASDCCPDLFFSTHGNGWAIRVISARP